MRRVDLINRRVELGLTQQDLATLMAVTISAVASWERGDRRPRARHRPRLAEILRVELEELAQMIDLDTPAAKLNGHEVHPWATHYDSLFQGSGRVELVELVQVHALLQTRDYASSIEHHGPLRLTKDQQRRRVEARLARQAALTREPSPLEVVAYIDEAALLRPIAPPAVMAAQLGHLVDMASEPHIEIRVVPCERSMFIVSNFELLTSIGGSSPFMAMTFSLLGPAYHEQPQQLADFARNLAQLDRVAMPAAASIDHIHHLQEKHQL